MADTDRARELAILLGTALTTLLRWRQQFAGDGDRVDLCMVSYQHVSHLLINEDRQPVLLICKEALIFSTPPGQIVQVLSYSGFYNGSEHSLSQVFTLIDRPLGGLLIPPQEGWQSHLLELMGATRYPAATSPTRLLSIPGS